LPMPGIESLFQGCLARSPPLDLLRYSSSWQVKKKDKSIPITGREGP
jgi:hypothetical protein